MPGPPFAVATPPGGALVSNESVCLSQGAPCQALPAGPGCSEVLRDACGSSPIY